MSSLRDFFAAVGFCKSTKELEKDKLIQQVMDYSLPYAAEFDTAQDDHPYEEKLRAVLSTASSYALSRLVAERIIVCLDKRFDNMEVGLFGGELHAGYYNNGSAKVMAIFDNDELSGGLFSTGMTDFSDKMINGLVGRKNSKLPQEKLLRGKIFFTASKMSSDFKWSGPETYEKELHKNPHLAEPPVTVGTPSVRSAPAPMMVAP